jgi:hypothetical protein
MWPPPDMPPRATPGGAGDELAILMQGLMGAQANDSGWPKFSGKYAEYPLFRKEWYACRQTYHGHVRDELVCCSLKERSLASSVKILVNDIEDLRKAWNTLDTCFDRPEKYIAEALEPIVKFRGYKMFDNYAPSPSHANTLSHHMCTLCTLSTAAEYTRQKIYHKGAAQYTHSYLPTTTYTYSYNTWYERNDNWTDR